MNIGIDARMYGPKQTGIGNYVSSLIDHLSLIDNKNTYHIFLGKEGYSRFRVQGKEFRFRKILADFPWYSLAEQTSFLFKLLMYPLDIMHFPHFNVPIFYYKPFIVTIHDLTPKFFPGEKTRTSWLRRKAYDSVLKHAIRASRSVITPSHFTKNDILRHFIVDRKKISVIHEGIPKLSFSEKRLALNQNNPYWPLYPIPYLLYVGVWRSHKNLLGLLDAFALLKKDGLPHSLVLAGSSGQYFEEIRKASEELGLTKWILAPGFLSPEELFAYYANASCVVLPSLYEGFGLVPLEALKVGIPVAVSDIPPLREVLGKSAFFFNPHSPQSMAETIKRALFDEAARRQKMREAKRVLLRYDWKKHARKILALYLTSARKR